MNTIIKIKGGVEGEKSSFYTDVKTDIKAGMQFGTTNNKIRKIGYSVIRQYFDNDVKDCQIGSQKIKSVFYN